jgi:cystathionine beta-lyase
VADVMTGAAEVLRALTDPGARVVINTPAYPPFWPTLREYGREVVEVPLLRTATGWDLDFDGLERAFAAGAGAYLLCNPHNPTGRVFERTQLERVAAIAERFGAVVVADEIHGPLTLPGARHVPFVSLGERAARNAVTLMSASKAWNIAGLKCAVVVAGSEEVRERLRAMPKELVGRVGHFGALASIAAFTEGLPWLRALHAHLDRNRRGLGELLAARLPSVRYIPPEASYLAWLDCSGLGIGPDPAAHFLDRGRVALVRGLNFGAEGAGFVRLNMGTSAGLLTEIVSRMARAMS